MRNRIKPQGIKIIKKSDKEVLKLEKYVKKCLNNPPF